MQIAESLPTAPSPRHPLLLQLHHVSVCGNAVFPELYLVPVEVLESDVEPRLGKGISTYERMF